MGYHHGGCLQQQSIHLRFHSHFHRHRLPGPRHKRHCPHGHSHLLCRSHQPGYGHDGLGSGHLGPFNPLCRCVFHHGSIQWRCQIQHKSEWCHHPDGHSGCPDDHCRSEHQDLRCHHHRCRPANGCWPAELRYRHRIVRDLRQRERWYRQNPDRSHLHRQRRQRWCELHRDHGYQYCGHHQQGKCDDCCDPIQRDL